MFPQHSDDDEVCFEVMCFKSWLFRTTSEKNGDDLNNGAVRDFLMSAASSLATTLRVGDDDGGGVIFLSSLVDDSGTTHTTYTQFLRFLSFSE